nr:Laminin G domain containing protein [Haemonchus contortus]
MTLGKNYSIALSWSGKRAFLKLGSSVTVLKIAAENEIISELTTGRVGSPSFTGTIKELSINGEAVRRKDLTAITDLRSLYAGPVFLKQNEYVQVQDVELELGAKLEVSLAVKRSSDEGIIFLLESSSSGQLPMHFVALALVDGRLQLLWELGDELKTMRTTQQLPASSWTDIRINLSPSEAAIYINDTLTESAPLLVKVKSVCYRIIYILQYIYRIGPLWKLSPERVTE